MIVQFVQFETALSEEEVVAIAKGRADQFRAVPGLVQKFYLKLNKPNHYGGFYVWNSSEDLMAFRESKLAKTIPLAYEIIGAPDIDVHELVFPLHEQVDFAALAKVA